MKNIKNKEHCRSCGTPLKKTFSNVRLVNYKITKGVFIVEIKMNFEIYCNKCGKLTRATITDIFAKDTLTKYNLHYYLNSIFFDFITGVEYEKSF